MRRFLGKVKRLLGRKLFGKNFVEWHKKQYWLTVTGPARSGTSILEASLAHSREVGLLHEIPRNEVQSMVGALANYHHDQARLPEYKTSKQRIYHYPEDIGLLVKAAFAPLFGSPKFIGTKDPEYWLRKHDYLPAELSPIHIIAIFRDPLVTVPKIRKILDMAIGGYMDPHHTLPDSHEITWIIVWNNIVYDLSRSKFPILVLFYEDLCRDKLYVEGQLQSFLGATDFNFSNFSERQADPGTYTFIHPELARFQELYKKDYRALLDERKLISLPYTIGDTIDFSKPERYRYAHINWYAIEENGSWTQSPNSAVHFVPEAIDSSRPLKVKIRALYAPIEGAEHEIKLTLNEKPLIKSLATSSRNGFVFEFDVPAGALKMGETALFELYYATDIRHKGKNWPSDFMNLGLHVTDFCVSYAE